MKINKDSFTLKLIQFNFNDKRPKDLCSFFWKGLASWISFFVAPWIHLIEFIVMKLENIKPSYYFNGPPWWAKTFLVGPVMWILSIGLMSKIIPFLATPLTAYLIGVPLILSIGILSIAIIAIIAFGFIELKEYICDKIDEYKANNPKPHKEPKENWIVAWFKQYKEKHCRLIEYK